MKLSSPCIDCGVPTKGTRCDDCRKQTSRMKIRTKHSKKPAPKDRGYDSRWKRLSKRARQAQNFCSDCGATEDLQADHSPQAWERYEKGLPLRLADVDVVCGPCNRKRGAARGESSQRDSKATNGEAGTEGHRHDSRAAHGHTDPGEGSLAGQRATLSRPQLSACINCNESHTMQGSEWR